MAAIQIIFLILLVFFPRYSQYIVCHEQITVQTLQSPVFKGLAFYVLIYLVEVISLHCCEINDAFLTNKGAEYLQIHADMFNALIGVKQANINARIKCEFPACVTWNYFQLLQNYKYCVNDRSIRRPKNEKTHEKISHETINILNRTCGINDLEITCLEELMVCK